MAKVEWTESALRQLDEIARYISLDKPAAAEAVVRRAVNATDQLTSLPALGTRIPGFSGRKYRRLWNKPVWIYYRLDEHAIKILHVRRAERLFTAEDLLED